VLSRLRAQATNHKRHGGAKKGQQSVEFADVRRERAPPRIFAQYWTRSSLTRVARPRLDPTVGASAVGFDLPGLLDRGHRSCVLVARPRSASRGTGFSSFMSTIWTHRSAESVPPAASELPTGGGTGALSEVLPIEMRTASSALTASADMAKGAPQIPVPPRSHGGLAENMQTRMQGTCSAGWIV
jgi:hypothetical protein